MSDIKSRPDDPAGVLAHKDRYKGGCALVVLGGTSSARWLELKEEIRPDVILGGNGVNSMIYGLDYWMCAENMKLSNKLALRGDMRAIDFMQMFRLEAGAKVKMISHWSWGLVKDRRNCIKIRRQGYPAGMEPANYSMRDYGAGFMNGWIYQDPKRITMPTCVGTVGSHLLHLAGILGVSQVHTIGFDLLFKDKYRHHFYAYPRYQVDRFRRPGMFVVYKDVHTQDLWVQTAKFLKTMEPVFERDELTWKDHSDGLLKVEGLKCAQ